MVLTQTRMDDNVLFLRRELEQILPRVFETIYTDIIYQNLIPVTNEVSPGADSYTYRIMNSVTKFKLISDKADDLPRSDVSRREVTLPIRMIGGSMAYSIDEIQKAQYANVPLQQMRANAMRRGYEEQVQRLSFWGDSTTGLTGFFNNGQVNKLVASSWINSGTSSDDMLSILNYAVTYITDQTNMVEQPDTLLVPYSVYRTISTTPRSTVSDTTVLSYFLNTNPFITSVQPVIHLDANKSLGNLSKDRIVAYRRSPDKLQLHIPQPLTVIEPQRRGLEYVINGYGKVGGAALYYPASVCYMDAP